MKYLEALKIAEEPGGEEPLPVKVAMSGTADLLDAFIRAHARIRGHRAEVTFLPFNTLHQALHGPPCPGEVVLLTPWDFVAVLDWRSGFPDDDQVLESLLEEAGRFAALVHERRAASVLYLPATIPPVLVDMSHNEHLSRQLIGLAVDLGAGLLDPTCFSMSSYLLSGSPFGSQALSDVAETVVRAAMPMEAPSPAKLLVTDLDGTLWHGVVGEDGVDGLKHGPEGLGFRHFLYQSFLRRLKRRGILVAAVSRNDPDLANAPFERGDMTLSHNDLITILASYNAKSSQIRQLADRLNLGLDSFVFVDDNPVELEEVSTQLPQVDCIPFPKKEGDLPAFLDRLAARFSTSTLTDEDRNRTDLYRRKLEGITPSDLAGADLTSFLMGLEMQMIIHDHSDLAAPSARARQLINKTNQFNLNGLRWTGEEIDEVLRSGGRHFGATIRDRSGSHGEVVSLLIDAEGTIRSFVMSCRVFQRRIEDAFLSWLLRKLGDDVHMHYLPTDRNAPFRAFIEGDAFEASDTGVRVSRDRFVESHGDSLELFRLTEASA